MPYEMSVYHLGHSSPTQTGVYTIQNEFFSYEVYL